MEKLTQANIGTLIDQLGDLRAQNAALKKRIEFLETVLQQRIVLTQKTYSEHKERFNQMQELVFKLFLQAPGQSFSYVEIQQEFCRAYPHLAASAVNVPRRVRELVQTKKLWQNLGDDGLARFWLKLEEKRPEA